MPTQNLWDATKTVLRGRKKKEKKTQISRREVIIKIQAKISEEEMKETIVKINKTKSWFFEKINKIDKPLARFIKKKRKNHIKHILRPQCYETRYQLQEKIVKNTNTWRLNISK